LGPLRKRYISGDWVGDTFRPCRTLGRSAHRPPIFVIPEFREAECPGPSSSMIDARPGSAVAVRSVRLFAAGSRIYASYRRFVRDDEIWERGECPLTTLPGRSARPLASRLGTISRPWCRAGDRKFKEPYAPRCAELSLRTCGHREYASSTSLPRGLRAPVRASSSGGATNKPLREIARRRQARLRIRRRHTDLRPTQVLHQRNRSSGDCSSPSR
jgi:hypothetical protein